MRRIVTSYIPRYYEVTIRISRSSSPFIGYLLVPLNFPFKYLRNSFVIVLSLIKVLRVSDLVLQQARFPYCSVVVENTEPL